MGNGLCNTADCECKCRKGYIGGDCSQKMCPHVGTRVSGGSGGRKQTLQVDGSDAASTVKTD